MAKPTNTTTKIEKGSAVLSNLPVDAIDVKPGFNPRGDDVGDVTDLVDMIRRREMLNTITVCPGIESGRYFLIAGARRLKAVRELGHKFVACNVRTDITIDSPDALATAMMENDTEGRRALPALAQARAFARLMALVEGESETAKHKAVAALCGRTSEGAYQNVRMTLRLLEVKGRVAELLDQGTVTKWTALAVTQAPEEIREAVAGRVTAGMTEADVKRIIRDLTHEQDNRVVDAGAPPADLETEEDEGSETTPAKPASRLKPSAAPVSLAPTVRPLLMRNRSEIEAKIDELVQDLCDATEDEEQSLVEALRNRIAALLWASGAVKEASTKERDFLAALNALIVKAENARGRATVIGGKG